jgi:hypothetical protein
LVKAGSGALLQNIMQRLKREAAASKASRIAFDLDPHDML